ncbi:hypothetical protein ACRYCC_13295 [Actinomadura scrupuli]|uniref:hypothetical protein n=1 Tax=Actinomadura scrupuli TaxID=559629 RepID=UPI003D9766B6
MDEPTPETAPSPPGVINLGLSLDPTRIMGETENLLRMALCALDMQALFLDAMNVIAELGHFALPFGEIATKLRVERGELSFVRIEMSHAGPELPDELGARLESLTGGDWSQEHLNSGRVVRATVHLPGVQYTGTHHRSEAPSEPTG